MARRSTTILTILVWCISFSFKSHAQSLVDMSTDPQWRALLHSSPGRSSRISSPNFFLSPRGNQNSREELDATISSLKDPRSDTQCRFPARYEWLASRLSEIAALPKKACPDLDTWYGALTPKRITLIFASAYINNPASAFGHTFLRIDQNEQESLLSYSANYAAATAGEDALTYAFNGIFGGYDGFYSVLPYYEKVKMYSDLEDRDIWEYPLKLTQAEIRRLVLHLWELRQIAASYYYFDENCAYQILELLAVAKPELIADKNFRTWVIPVDTLRLLAPLIDEPHFRPSAGTLLRNRISRATVTQREEAGKLADPQTPMSPSKRDAATLDLAYELLTYRKVAGAIDEQRADPRLFELLKARSENPELDRLGSPPIPTVRPENGHGTAEVALFQGRKQDQDFTRLAVRPAFHDLLDPQGGYQKGAQIKFFEVALDQTESEGLDLAFFNALDITSLSPVSEFFDPLSWNVRTGMRRIPTEERDDPLVSFLGGSAGKSFEIFNDSLFYLMTDAEIRAGKYYSPDLNPGAGGKLGFLSYLSDNWALQGEVHALRFVEQQSIQSRLDLRYALGVQANLVASISQEREFDRKDSYFMFGVEWYFTP